MQKTCNNILEYCVYLIVFFIPILYFGQDFYLPYVSSKVFLLYGAVDIIFAIWVYCLYTDQSYRLSKKIFALFSPVFLFILWMTVSGVMSLSPAMSFWSSIERGTGLITLYHLLAFSLVVSSLVKKVDGESFLRKLLFWFLGGAFLVVLSVWLGDEGFNLPFVFLQKSKGGGLIGNSSLAAAYLIFAIFFAIFIFFQKNIGRNLKTWAFVVFGFIIFSPLFLNLYSLFYSHAWFISARAAAVSIFGGIVVSGLVYLCLSKNKNHKILGFTCTFICICIFIFTFVKIMTPNTTFHNKFGELTGSNRLIFWDIARKGIGERPVLGWGPENYGIVYHKYFNSDVFVESGTAEVWNDRAHNIFFDIGIAGGLPAIMLYLAILFSIVFSIYKGYIADNLSRIQAGVLTGLVAAYVIQNLLVFDSILSLLGFFVLIGVIFGLSERRIPMKVGLVSNNEKFIFIPILVLLVLCIYFFSWRPIQKVKTFSEVLAMSLNKRPDHYTDLLTGSIVGDAWETGKIADDVYLVYSQNKESLRKDTKLLPFAQRDLEKFLEYLEIISKKNPVNYRLRLNLARLYNIYVYLKGEEFGLATYILDLEKDAQNLSPNDPQVDWAMSQTYIYANNLAGAEMALKHGIDVSPHFSWSYQVLLNFAQDTNNRELYNETLLRAKKAIPNFSFNKP